jgi:superoxide dismutase
MSKYILKSIVGSFLEDMDKCIKENICFPLIREIEFKYGLKVYKVEGKEGINSTPSFYMCYPNGIPCGEVFAKKTKELDVRKCTQTDILIYNFKTPYYRKARGSSESDRSTISSKKISTLMGTIHRQKVIQPFIDIFNKDYRAPIFQGLNIMKNHFGKDNKFKSIATDDLHALVANALGENPNSYGLSLNLSLCKNLLDHFNKCDNIEAEKLKQAKRFFGNPFYAIGVDRDKHIIIGKLKIVDDKMQIVEDFSRTLSLDHKEDLTAILTMMKVANENKGDLTLNCFPNKDEYDVGLDVVYTSVWYRNRDDSIFHWTFIPCQ